MRKPFQRKGRETWYVKDEAGKFISLESDEEKAFAKWEAMKAIGETGIGIKVVALASRSRSLHWPRVTLPMLKMS